MLYDSKILILITRITFDGA